MKFLKHLTVCYITNVQSYYIYVIYIIINIVTSMPKFDSLCNKDYCNKDQYNNDDLKTANPNPNPNNNGKKRLCHIANGKW